jgi:hypothetical protein
MGGFTCKAVDRNSRKVVVEFPSPPTNLVRLLSGQGTHSFSGIKIAKNAMAPMHKAY